MIDRTRKLEENQRRGDMCNGIKNCKKKIIDVKVSKNFKFEKNLVFLFIHKNFIKRDSSNFNCYRELQVGINV